MTPKKLRSRNIAAGCRTKVARARTKAVARRGTTGRAPTSRIRPPTRSQRMPASVASARRAAGARPAAAATTRYGPSRPRAPREERAEVQAARRRRRVAGLGAGRVSRRQREPDERQHEQDRAAPRRPGTRSGPPGRRTRSPARRRATGPGRTRSGAPVRAGPGPAGRGGPSRRSPKATSSMARTARTGQPPAEPYGTHSSVTIAGAARRPPRSEPPPRGENAMMKIAR